MESFPFVFNGRRRKKKLTEQRKRMEKNVKTQIEQKRKNVNVGNDFFAKWAEKSENVLHGKKK